MQASRWRPSMLHRAPEAEQRVVVGGRPRGDRLELRGGALVALRVEQRAPERLADGGLVGLEVARFAQRHDRRLVVAVVEQLTATLVEVVDALHRAFYPLLAQRPRRRRGSPRRPAPCCARGTCSLAAGARRAAARQDRDLVRVDVEADVGAGDVVDDDRVEALARRACRARARAPARRARRRSRRASGPRVGSRRGRRARRRSARAGSPGARGSAFLILPVRRGGGREVGDGGAHQQHVAARRTRSSQATLQLGGGAHVAAGHAIGRGQRDVGGDERHLRAASLRRARRARSPCARRSCCRCSARCRSARACRRR